MRLLEMRLESRRVSLAHAFQGGIEGQHEPAERAACAGLRIRLDADRVGLPSVAVASVCRVLTRAHVTAISDKWFCATSGF
jgi:hypothetical protein